MYRALMMMGISLLTMTAYGCSPASGEAATASTTVETTSIETSTSVATSTTTTVIVEPVDVGSLMVEVLSSPDFSAQLEASVEQTTPNGPVTSAGLGSVLGDDSGYELRADFSNLTGISIEPTLGLVGPGFQIEKVSGTRVIDDFVFSNNGERWMIRLREPTDDTTVGHILSEIARTDWVDVGTETVDGEDLYRLEPAVPLELELTYFDIDPESVTESETTAVVYATEAGFPAIIEVDMALEIGDEYGADWEIEYVLSQTSAASFVGPPDTAWVSIQDLSEGRFNAGEDSLLEFALPTSFLPVQADAAYLAAESELLGGIVADVQTVLFSNPPITFDQALAGVTRDLDLTEPQIEQSEYGGYPAATITATHPAGQPHYIFVSLFSNNTGVAVVIQMLGSGDDPALEQELFNEMLSTFSWGGGDGAVPGSSVGSALLQMDTESIVLAIASVNRDAPCDSSIVVFTEFLTSTGDAWTEDWYVSSCGALDIYPVTFTESPGGGTHIGVSSEPIRVELFPNP